MTPAWYRAWLPTLLLALAAPAAAAPLFSDDERTRIVEFWNSPGRYRATAPAEVAQNGPWVVRLTPEASKWFLAYQKAIGQAKAPPTVDGRATSAETEPWERWVQARLDYDRWQAQQAADAANAGARGTTKDEGRATNAERQGSLAEQRDPAAQRRSTGAPPVPGPIPAALLAAAGNPPAFAAAVAPLRHVVTFEDGESYGYNEHVVTRPRYAYYRFPRGTVSLGTMLREMPAEELESLFAAARMSPSEQRIARAVSRLEGGFESVNTYDTGYVSVGFIQFVTLENGRHSLSEVLLREKADHSDTFQGDFRQYGIEVSADNELVVVDPATGAELAGPAAVARVIEDKRLIAVFQRAGRHSTAFRVAQIQVAKTHYWPADDPVTVAVNGQTLNGKLSDVIRSEAGLATLFDRKVNRGTIAPFAEVVAKVMTDHALISLADASAYEREIVAALKYRADFLADASLGQPPAPPAPSSTSQ